MNRTFLAIAGISGALAVGLGAMGAHALESRLGTHSMEIFHTAVHYHFYHTLALLGVALLWAHRPSIWLKAAGVLFIVGLFLFSGSLYVLAVTGFTKLGMVAPVGGLSFIAGWVCLAVDAWKRR